MNHIEQAYEKGFRIREKRWVSRFWIKKYSDSMVIWHNEEKAHIKLFPFKYHPENWEIWQEEIPLLKDQQNVKQQIQTHLNQIQEILKQL